MVGGWWWVVGAPNRSDLILNCKPNYYLKFMKIPLAEEILVGKMKAFGWVDLILDCNSQSELWMVHTPDSLQTRCFLWGKSFSKEIHSVDPDSWCATKQVARQRLGIACLLATCFSTAHLRLQHLTALLACLQHVFQQQTWLVAIFTIRKCCDQCMLACKDCLHCVELISIN